MRREPGDAWTRDERSQISGPALRAFFEIATAWQLTPFEQARLLGHSSPLRLKHWRRAEGMVLTRDALERISHILGIFKAINNLIPSEVQADGWIRRGNAAPLFGGRSALDRMLGGNVGDLYAVRAYLDGQVAG